MNTNDLISRIAADAGPPATSPDRMLILALLAAVLAVAAVFPILAGPLRSDLDLIVQSPQLAAKFAVTLSLLGSAAVVLRLASVPVGSVRRGLRALWLPAALLAAAVVGEIATLPAGEAYGQLVGNNALVCLVKLPALGALPLAILILAIRHAAPARPGLAGLAAGLTAGAVAATAYALYCPDDSPLFVATWYSIAIGGLALVGAAAGQRFARW